MPLAEIKTAGVIIAVKTATAEESGSIVYRVNYNPAAAHLEYLPIQHEGARAVQPFSVRSTSPNFRLGQRLLAFLKANHAKFEQAGFQWRGEAAMQSKDIQVPDWLKAK